MLDHRLLALAGLLLFSYFAFAQCPNLVWSDEFDGTALNLDNWTYELGDGCDRGPDLCGWGNNEAQSYQRENAVVADGLLTITAREEMVGNSQFTSARIVTKNKQDFRYGWLEARIKVPRGRGTWPAFWMLSTDEVYGTWPQSGEIDIMEYVGKEPDRILGTVHFGQLFPNNQFLTEEFVLTGDSLFYEEYHTYAIHWEENRIRWFVDGVLYATQTPADLAPQRWPFDQDFHFILNLALGGTLGGPTIDRAQLPAELAIDYVRVYDDEQPFLSGERAVGAPGEESTYQVSNLPAGTTVNWRVPSGASIASGQGTSAITVVWGEESGAVEAAFTDACGAMQRLATTVTVAPGLSREFSLLNFDDDPLLTFDFADGTLNEIDNPTPAEPNTSARVARYTRDGGTQFDVIIYRTNNAIPSAAPYVSGEKAFFIDVLTDAPAGTEILLQLESPAAAPTNFPTGRHSRYVATIAEAGGWQRLRFNFLDQPDASVNPTRIDDLILLFASNTFTSDTYTFDNLDGYGEDTTTNITAARILDLPVRVAPNPTEASATINFSLPQTTDVAVEVMDATGRVRSRQPALRLGRGEHRLAIDLIDLPAGLYYARLVTDRGIKAVPLVRR